LIFILIPFVIYIPETIGLIKLWIEKKNERY
jgi:hypothetical protein